MAKVRLYGDTSGYVDLKAPDVANDVTITLPNESGPFATENYVDSELAALSVGKVLQVVQGTLTTSFTTTASNTWTATGLSATITPATSTNKVLVLCSIALSFNNDAGAGRMAQARLLRGATAISAGAEGSRAPGIFAWQLQGSIRDNMQRPHVSWLDSPASDSPVTYSAEVRSPQGGEFIAVNRGFNYSDSANYVTTASSIILMEIAE